MRIGFHTDAFNSSYWSFTKCLEWAKRNDVHYIECGLIDGVSWIHGLGYQPHVALYEDPVLLRRKMDGYRVKFSQVDAAFPLYTHPRFLPGSKVNMGSVRRSILNAGCIIDRATITDSIIGIRSVIGDGARIEQSLILGADRYEPAPKKGGGVPRIGIGPGTIIRKAIVDTNVRIGRGVVLRNMRRHRKYDDPQGSLFVRDGIIVVPKGAVIEDGTKF